MCTGAPMNDSLTEPERQPTTVADRLAREIKRLRLATGLSQRALATKIGYSRQYVSMTEWEDANLPSRDLIAAIDAALSANGALIALRAQAKTDQQTIRRQAGERTAAMSIDPRISNVANISPAGHLPDLTAIYPCQAGAAEEVRTLAKGAGAVDVMAVRGLGILGLNDSLLRKAVSAEAQLRVLLLSPDSAAVARRADEVGESAESGVADHQN